MGVHTDGSLELTLPPEPRSVAEARSRVLEAVGDGFDLQTLRLLISELVTNAVRHGGCEEPVELHAHWNSVMRVEVIDHGGGFTPAPRSGDSDDPGGFGLFLVGRLADQWGVETNDATCVWFILRRD
jgi:anti-sigma regulatory factor (Ser/Thr protein kinase)